MFRVETVSDPGDPSFWGVWFKELLAGVLAALGAALGWQLRNERVDKKGWNDFKRVLDAYRAETKTAIQTLTNNVAEVRTEQKEMVAEMGHMREDQARMSQDMEWIKRDQ